MTNAVSSHDLIEQFRIAWKQPGSIPTSGFVAQALTSWLILSQARAVGWWRCDQNELRMLGFVAASDMPLDVQNGFTQAMQRVSLERIELGCVRAAAEQRPVIAREDAAKWGLGGSASWLQRFAAQQSLAIPIVCESRVTGVLAIATEKPFDESSEQWKLLVKLVTALQTES